MEKKDVCFIAAKLKKDYTFDAIKNAGFDIIIPYKDTNLFRRLIREFWFRLRLPKRSLFFNKKAICGKKIIIVYDPLITKDYLAWLRKNNPDAKIYLQYVNRADTTINPELVPENIIKVSYDSGDCNKYGMQFIEPSYFDIYAFDGANIQKEYDVLFLGRDKGRLVKILDFENNLKKLNLATYFHVCADRKYLKFKNKNYKRVLDYDEYLELLKKSKSLLNIARLDQDAVTQRELECVFDTVKCITTNKSIVKFKLYDSSRFFIFDFDNPDYQGIVDFLNTPFKPITKEELDEFRFERLVETMYLNKK